MYFSEIKKPVNNSAERHTEFFTGSFYSRESGKLLPDLSFIYLSFFLSDFLCHFFSFFLTRN